MRDFKLRALVPAHKFTMPALDLKVCQSAWRGFNHAVTEVNNPVYAAVLFGLAARTTTLAQSAACCDVFGSVYPPPENASGNPEFAESWRNRTAAVIGDIASDGMENAETEIAEGMDYALTLAPSAKIHAVMESLLRAIVSQAWTTVEVMIEELHKKAIEAHKQLFRPEVIAKHDKGKITHKGAYQFRSRDHFKASYKDAFDDPAISLLLESDDLSVMAVVRNVGLHRGGVIDRRFMEDELPKCPKLAKLNPVLNAPLVLDGEIVRDMQKAIFLKGSELIQTVDCWLKTKGAK